MSVVRLPQALSIPAPNRSCYRGGFLFSSLSAFYTAVLSCQTTHGKSRPSGSRIPCLSPTALFPLVRQLIADADCQKPLSLPYLFEKIYLQRSLLHGKLPVSLPLPFGLFFSAHNRCWICPALTLYYSYFLLVLFERTNYNTEVGGYSMDYMTLKEAGTYGT